MASKYQNIITIQRQNQNMQVNEIYCIGSNKFGQAGAGKKYHNQTFTSFNRIIFPVFIKQVVCGSHHSGLLTLDGYVYMMGSNINGTLGTPTATINYSYCPILVQNLHDVNKISSGYHHMCAISQGRLYSWGKGVDGQLGTGKQINCAIPTLVQSFGEDVEEVSCGLNHTLVKTSNKKCYAFGNGIYGQLGIGSNKNSLTPVLVKIEKVDQISAGQNFSLFLKDSVLYGSGDNSYGQISQGLKKKYALEPVQINISKVTTIRAGKFSTAVLQDKCLCIWGSKQHMSPLRLNQVGGDIMDIQTGGNLVYCLTSLGELYEWKNNDPNYQNQMKQSQLRQKTILGFAVGESHSLILGDIVNQIEDYDTQFKVLENIADSNSIQSKMMSQKSSVQKILSQHSCGQSQGPSISCEHYSRTPSSIMRQPNNFLKAQSKLNIQVGQFLKDNIQKVESKQNITANSQIRQRLQRGQSQIHVIKKSDPQVSECLIKISQIMNLLQKNNELNHVPSSAEQFSRKMAKSKMERSVNKQNKPVPERKNRELIMQLRQKELKISQLQEKLSRKDIQIQSQRQLINLLRKIAPQE